MLFYVVVCVCVWRSVHNGLEPPFYVVPLCVYVCGAACTMDLNQIGGWQGGGDVTCGSGMGRECLMFCLRYFLL